MTRILIIAVGALAAILLLVFTVNHFRNSAGKATERRVERGQAGATVESAKDAIATQGAAATRERASEDLGRSNEKDIRDAKGSADPVNPDARDAGLRALCRRDSYRHTERCKLLATPTP